VCSYSVITFDIHIIYVSYAWLSEMCSYGMAVGCFTDVVLHHRLFLHSLNNYRDERATERRHLGMEVVSTCGPEFLSFHKICRQYLLYLRF